LDAQEMSIGTIHSSEQGHLIEVEFQVKTKRYQVYFRSNETVLSENLESFIACALLPCMKAGGGALISKGEVSQQFIASLSTIQDIYCSWNTLLHRVEFRHIMPRPKIRSQEERVGAFFSGGLDSFYTFLKHQDEIEDLIFVHGLDIRLGDTSLRRRTSEMIHKVVSSFGKNVIEIETNIRSFLDSYVNWGLTHGATLSAIGHLLFPPLSRIYIPATHTYAELLPWGSHPLLDPLWSSETLQFVHDGCEATRIDKAALLSKYDIALQSLRVCWKNPHGAYNCGQCEKCLRTMLNLFVVGALERCTTFDAPLKFKRILALDVTDENTRAFIQQNLKALENIHDDQKVKALRAVLNRPQWLTKTKKRLHSHVVNYPLMYQLLKRVNRKLERLTIRSS
jgi:hypothetical protein